MLEIWLSFTGAALVILIAGFFMVRATDVIAERSGLGRLLTGALLLAGATSLPELLVDSSAVLQAHPNIAIGDLLGSSLMNLLILVLAGFFRRRQKGPPVAALLNPRQAGLAVLSMAVTALAGLMILWKQGGEFRLGRLGLGPLLIAALYLWGVRRLFRDPNLAATEEGGGGSWSLFLAILIYAVTALAILAVAPHLAAQAGLLAERTGLGGSFVGTTLVALCTSLPELVSTLVAIRLGAEGLAVGNIFGSNAFNMLLLLPLDALTPGSLLATVSPLHVMTCLGTVFVTALCLLAPRRAGVVLMLVILALFGLLYQSGSA